MAYIGFECDDCKASSSGLCPQHTNLTHVYRYDGTYELIPASSGTFYLSPQINCWGGSMSIHISNKCQCCSKNLNDYLGLDHEHVFGVNIDNWKRNFSLCKDCALKIQENMEKMIKEWIRE